MSVPVNEPPASQRSTRGTIAPSGDSTSTRYSSREPPTAGRAADTTRPPATSSTHDRSVSSIGLPQWLWTFAPLGRVGVGEGTSKDPSPSPCRTNETNHAVSSGTDNEPEARYHCCVPSI